MNPTNLAYRKTAAEGTTGFGLLIALYDTLAGDLRRAAAAQRKGNLEERTQELKHALLVVGVLENWINAESGELAQQLIAFYSKMRRIILDAQVKQSAEMLEKQMVETLRIREVWQRLDVRSATSGPEILPPERTERYSTAAFMQMEQSQLSWSA
jgi:flagellar biosynthetic protein FliS